MRKTSSAGVWAIAVLALSGCAEQSQDRPPAAPTKPATISTIPPATSASSSPAPSPIITALISPTVPSPSPTILGDAEQAYLLRLADIDERLLRDDTYALAAGVVLCRYIADDRWPDATLQEAAQRLYRPSMELTTQQAGDVLAAARLYCTAREALDR